MPTPNLPPDLREFDDTTATRKLIYDNALEAVSKRFPIEDDQHILELKDAHYDGPQTFTLEQQKQALMKDRQLRTPIKGTWRLMDKKTGAVLDQREDVVMHVPYFTDRGTFVNNGNEYSVVNQSRLKPGAYVRKQRNGEVETHFNVSPGTGKSFRLHLEPETGVMRINVDQSKIPVYPLLKTLGVTDQELMKAWGPDLVAINAQKSDARAIPKLYQRMSGYKYDPKLSSTEQEQYLRDSIAKFEVDPDVVARTMGMRDTRGITPQLLLRATQKMFNVSKGEEEPDDRDAPMFSNVYSVEDFVKERIDKDAGRLSKNLLWKIRRSKNLQPIQRGALNPYIHSMILGSGLAMPLEETNPLHTLEQMNRITKLGEGGISSAESVTDEARDVNNGQMGFIDGVNGPEGCYHPDMEVMARTGWIKWPSVTLDTELACLVDNRLEFHKPDAVHRYEYSGYMYNAQTRDVSYSISKAHKLWCRNAHHGSEYRWEHAPAAYGNTRYVRTGGHEPYAGTIVAGTEFILPEVVGGNAVKNETAPIAMPLWAEFMGWFISEGSYTLRKDGNHLVCIAQHDPENQQRIEAVLKQLPFPYSPSRSGGVIHGYHIVRKQLGLYLSQLGKSHDKFIPEYFFACTPEVRKILLTTLCRGDGRKKGRTYSYCTTSERLAHDVERLAFSLGYSVRKRFEPDDRPQSLTGGCWAVHLHLTTERQISYRGDHYSKVPYDGYVYCATVPGSLVYVRNGGFGGHWSGNLNIGIDVRAAFKTFKGKDKQLYAEFREPRSGKEFYLRPEQIADKVLAFPGQMKTEGDTAVAMVRGKIERVAKDKVDYEVPSTAHMMSSHSNLVPIPTGLQPGRAFYAAKFFSQYLPQVKGEVPLVDSMTPDGRETFTEHYGRKIGTLKSPIGGAVMKVNDTGITVRGEDGQTHVIDTVKDFPFNRLTGISYYPTVKPGDVVNVGDMVAHSNFTDSKTGALNMGVNLKSAIIPARGHSYEDAYTISESAAKKLATDRLFGYDQEARHGVEIAKNKYIGTFPDPFSKVQIDTIGDDGVVKPGTIVNKGDPIILAVGPKMLTSADAQLGKLHKVLRNAFTDKSVVWEHNFPGTVTDSTVTQSGARVNIKTQPPVQAADKLSTRFGLKGVTGRIIPDDQMPRDLNTNEPFELLLNPMGIQSRVAPAQIIEMVMGKIAKATGKQVRIPQEAPPGGWAKWAKTQLDAAGLKEDTDLFDPESGKTIKNIGDGHIYVSAFHHIAEKKLSQRGESGAYTIDEQPAKGGPEGSKRYSSMDVHATLAHGATEVVRDAMLIRGNKSENYWKALKLGQPLPEPERPFIYDKFLNTLKAGGINIVDKGDTMSLLPLTDRDVDALSKGDISKPDLITSDFEPVAGGLFDVGKTGGMSGNRWTSIKLNEPMPNPVMEEPVRRILGLKVKELHDVIAGRQELNGLTGGRAIQSALKNVDIDKELEEQTQKIRTLRGANRDNAIKIVGYLAAAKKQGVHPSDWVITKVPVLPPMFRPISRLGDIALQTDLNELYRDLIETNNNIHTLRKDLPESELHHEKSNLYDAVTAVYGLGDSITPEGQSKRLKGAIRQIVGTSPKTGLFQSKVLSKTVGGVARGVVTPDPNLDMDSAGIPADTAWTLYKDFVTRRLVRKGYPPTRALEMIDKRDPVAKDMLDAEMQSRPVIMDRAPTWHKFNLMAFYPHIVEGHTMRVSPLITKGYTMDFDGDQANFHVPVSEKAVEQTISKMMPSRNLTSLTDLRSVRHAPSMEMTMGLFQLTQAPSKKPPQIFKTAKDARHAYEDGLLGVNDPIIVQDR